MLNFSALQSKTTLATVSWRFQALGHWYQPHWWPQSATVLPSEKVEISLRGSVSFPRQHSTGGKTRLLGISKRGNEYLRRMLLHGARSVVAQIGRTPSALGLWLSDLSARSHRNVTVVALANKMARTAWAILSRGTHYCAPSLVAA